MRTVAEVVASLGEVFAVPGPEGRDSGHTAYGVRGASGERWFVKASRHREALRRSAEVSNAVVHPAVLPVGHVIEAPDGVVLVSRWSDGELLHRTEPAAQRFRALPTAEAAAALDQVIELHVALAATGWVSGDLYDGSLMYDFALRQVRVIDFECYRPGPYVNEVGRLPGSTRFMAPEEHVAGALVDERTTVFNLARLVAVLLLPHDRDLVARATAEERTARPDLATFLGEFRAGQPPKPTSLPSGSR